MGTDRAFQRADVTVDTHQDRAHDDHAESGRHGAVAAASADVTFCSTPACCLKIRIRLMAWYAAPATVGAALNGTSCRIARAGSAIKIVGVSCGSPDNLIATTTRMRPLTLTITAAR